MQAVGTTPSILHAQELNAKDAKIAALETRVYTDARFNALELGQERIGCEMLKQPKVFGQAFVTCGQPIPAATGFGC